MDTQGITLDFGKHKGVLVTRAPHGYLTWMCSTFGEDTPRGKLARAELDRRGTSYDSSVYVSGHAIDGVSVRDMGYYKDTRNKGEGISSWLNRKAAEALQVGEEDPANKGRVTLDGRRFVFEFSTVVPTLRTVLPPKGKRKRKGGCDEA